MSDRSDGESSRKCYVENDAGKPHLWLIHPWVGGPGEEYTLERRKSPETLTVAQSGGRGRDRMIKPSLPSHGAAGCQAPSVTKHQTHTAMAHCCQKD